MVWRRRRKSSNKTTRACIVTLSDTLTWHVLVQRTAACYQGGTLLLLYLAGTTRRMLFSTKIGAPGASFAVPQRGRVVIRRHVLSLDPTLLPPPRTVPVEKLRVPWHRHERHELEPPRFAVSQTPVLERRPHVLPLVRSRAPCVLDHVSRPARI